MRTTLLIIAVASAPFAASAQGTMFDGNYFEEIGYWDAIVFRCNWSSGGAYGTNEKYAAVISAAVYDREMTEEEDADYRMGYVRFDAEVAQAASLAAVCHEFAARSEIIFDLPEVSYDETFYSEQAKLWFESLNAYQRGTTLFIVGALETTDKYCSTQGYLFASDDALGLDILERTDFLSRFSAQEIEEHLDESRENSEFYFDRDGAFFTCQALAEGGRTISLGYIPGLWAPEGYERNPSLGE